MYELNQQDVSSLKATSCLFFTADTLWLDCKPTFPQVVIRRRPLFYAVNLLMPSIFLMVMDIVGFYLPPDSGERVSFKITLLLGYSVFLIIVSDTLPATAIGTPLIGDWGPLMLISSLHSEQTVCKLMNLKYFT